MKFAQVPITTVQEYQAMIDRGVDFCDGCGGWFQIDGLEETMLEASGGFLVPGVVCGPCRQAISREEEGWSYE